ncbi:recombinase family protein [Streptomyces sp. NPDC127112]|uniref:recombinase family protein n=1 Tax=Streptomyces sp. NPDC127112 TaxID=3345364 RepID=UPI003626FECB
MKNAAGAAAVEARERRLQARGIARLSDVHLCRPRGLTLPHWQGQGGHPVPHRPLPPRSPTRQGPSTSRPPPCASPAPPGPRCPGRGTADAEPVGHARLGYARASTARQSRDTQLDSLAEAGVTRIFSEKISTRATQRPELDKAAVALASELRASGVRVTLVVHEHKRLDRGIELATLAEELKASDVGLEFRPVRHGTRVHPRPHP